MRNMLAFGWDAVVGFSSIPLRIASVLGIVFSFLGLLYLAGVRDRSPGVHTEQAVAGWTSVVAAVIVLGGVQLLCLGIIGQYLGRMYDEIKGRPLFLVAEDTARSDPSTPTVESR